MSGFSIIPHKAFYKLKKFLQNLLKIFSEKKISQKLVGKSCRKSLIFVEANEKQNLSSLFTWEDF